uniref:Membrane magnesium transporter n=1 Tax=Parasteatoda tepidariorum TaxID=114398 RepID=A0A2L2YCV2_PARTP
MSNHFGKVIVAFGLFSLLHSSFSAAQYRSNLRLMHQNFFLLPCDIIAQTLLSLFLTLWGVTIIAGDFKRIKSIESYQNKTSDELLNRSSFYVFSHRGRSFFQE